MGNGAASVKHAIQSDLLADRLKEVREDHGLSLRGFASGVALVGFPVSHTSVTDYETGTPVPADYLAGVCVAYDINPAYLFWGEPPKHRQTPSVTERVLEIIRDVSKATNEEDEERLARIIQAMKDDDDRSSDP